MSICELWPGGELIDRGMTMDIREFEYLVKIAEYESITKAADQLFVTQSALSKFVQKLEAEMGTPIFQRIGKKFVPTYAGERCLDYAAKILSLNQQMTDEVRQIQTEGKERIRLGFHGSWSYFFFSDIFPEFQKMYPHVELIVNEMNVNRTMDKLAAGEIDLAILTMAQEVKAQYHCERLKTQRMVLAVNHTHPLTKHAAVHRDYPYPLVDLQLLNDQPFVLRSGIKRTYNYTMDLFRRNRIELRVVLETESRTNALRAVEYGVGATIIVDDPVLLLSTSGIRYLSFEDPKNNESYLSIVTNKERRLTRVESALIQCIKHKYQELEQVLQQ